MEDLKSIPKGVKIAIILFLAFLGAVLVRVTAMKRIPANTVGVKVSAFNGDNSSNRIPFLGAFR